MQLAKNGPTIPKPKASKKVKPPTVPEKNLVVQHNISQNGFQHADELGGLAAPSIAVAHKDKPLTGFGDITLLAHPSLIDPKSKVPVFDADAYTPRQPRAEYRVNKKAADKLRKETKEHANDLSTNPSYEEVIEKNGIDGALQDHNIRSTLGLAFLKERGQHHDILQAAKENVSNYDSNERVKATLYNKIRETGKTKLSDEEISQLLKDSVQQHKKETADDYRRVDPEKADEWAEESARRVYRNLNYTHPQNHLKYALSDNHFDSRTYKNGVEEKVKDNPEFEDWARQKLAPLQGEKYIPKRSEYSGALRKLPYNMTNILKTMKLSKLKGEEGGMYGLGHIRAAGVKQFRNLDEIKKHGDRLVTPQEMEVHKKDLDSQFHSLVSKIQSETGRKDFGSMDAIALALKDSMGRGKYLHQTFKDNALNGVSPETLREAQAFKQKLLNSPSEYFEAKPKRGVGFHEFKAAAVPDDAPQHIVDRLHRHGLTTERYKKGDDEDRKRAIQKLAQEHDLMLSEKEFFTPLERIRKYIR